MTKTIFSKVMWVGRATVFLVGLSVILALVFGVATTAMGANGQAWILGQNNVATAITALAGPNGVNGAMLAITNNNADANDTALALNVQSGEAPMRVNSNRKVANLNVDRVDDREASSFANGVGGVATNADKLDNNDSAAFQKRVSGECAVGSSMRSIGADGTTVTCEQDDDLSGDAAGGDLSGTYPNPTLANGAVEPANFGAIPTARVAPNVNQSAADGDFVILAFSREEHDVGNLHDNSVNNTRLTAPVSGVYTISAAVPFGADPDGVRRIDLVANRPPETLNGAGNLLTMFQGPPTNSTTLATDQTISTQAKLAAGDYVEVRVQQQNTGADTLTIFASRAHFEMTWIAPG